LFLLYLSFYLMDFGQIWYLRKGLFEENPTPSVADVWRRTRRGRRILPGDEPIGTDKGY